jgi:sarcosine oxidase subunit gamma
VSEQRWPIEFPGLRVADAQAAFSVLRVWRPTPEIGVALGHTFGLEWPIRPNTWAANAATTVLWLAPAEWAVVGVPHAEAAARTARACEAAPHDLVDLGEGRVRFDVSGPRALDLLAKGCSLDLHPRAFAADACAQTLLAQVPVLIARGGQAGTVDSVPALRLWADASLAQYLRTWFSDAALEYCRP